MKRTLVLIGIVTVVTGLMVSSSFAEGNYAGEFLNVGVGARALGMGGAFIGVANDGTAAYWNPAGMGSLNKKEITAMYCPASFESLGSGTLGVAALGASYNYFGLVWKLGSMRVGGSMIQLGISDIYDTRGLDYDDANDDGKWNSGEKVYYDQDYLDEHKGQDLETAYILSFSQNFSAGLSVGANVKLLSQSIFEYSSSGFGIDIGLMYRMNPGNPLMGENSGGGLSVGVVVRDVIGTSLAWSRDDSPDAYVNGSTEWVSLTNEQLAASGPDVIPPGIGAGVAYTLTGMPGISALTVAADVTYKYGAMDFSVGTEIWIANMLALRAGVKQLAGPTSALNVMNGSAGIGLKLADMVEVNYAFSGLFSIGPNAGNTLGGAHRASLAFRF